MIWSGSSRTALRGCPLSPSRRSGIDEVTDPQGLPSETEHLFFYGPVGNCKSIVLALVFRPRIDDEGLDIESWGFGVIVDAPTRRAVAAANPLVLVNCFEKLLCIDRVDLVFDGDEHRPIVGLGLHEHRGSWPVIPYVQSRGGFQQRKGQTQEQA